MSGAHMHIHTYVASGHVYGREFPSERFNFSTIASPSTIDALLRTEKKMCSHTCTRRLYTRSDPSLFHISPRHKKNEQVINEDRLMTIPWDITTCVPHWHCCVLITICNRDTWARKKKIDWKYLIVSCILYWFLWFVICWLIQNVI